MTLPFFFMLRSSWPFLETHLEMSSSAAGSSALTESILPVCNFSIAIFVLNTGSGQNNPVQSILVTFSEISSHLIFCPVCHIKSYLGLACPTCKKSQNDILNIVPRFLSFINEGSRF